MVVVTNQFIESGMSDVGGWTRKQIQALGIAWPPREGWKQRLEGVEIPDEDAARFLELKNSSKLMRKIMKEKNPELKNVPSYQAVEDKPKQPSQKEKSLARKQERKLAKIAAKREARARKREKAKQKWAHLQPDLQVPAWVNPNGNVNYTKYLRSKEWKRKRQEALAHYGALCDECGMTESLHVHHKTYERLGNENVEDLQILCKGCHGAHHEQDGRHATKSTSDFIELARTF